MASDEASETGSNFIRDIIIADNQAGTYGGRVVTRFPPEPNGYLHIGHAKAICIDFGMAKEFGGACHLRFDDTNPTKEDTEYVDAIQQDVKWLGFDWGEKLFYASDFFAQMYELAEGLIRDGKAYVCHLSEAEFKQVRGTVTEAGSHSPHRTRSVEENIAWFRKMKAGELEDGTCVLRAKADMGSNNMKMRDPPLYRIRHATHHRTGDDWCIYPMYDYAHPLEDALEGVTHSLCSLEFQDNREIYDWVIDHTAVRTRPRQYEFARLNLSYTVMSKRKLLQLVEEGHVSGWDDPRMPTLTGMRRLGIPSAAIRDLVTQAGVAKANSIVDIATFEHCIRDRLNHQAPRVMGVLNPVKLIIDSWDKDQVEWLDADLWPHDVPKEDSRKIPFTRELFIEREDFALDPPKGFKRMTTGREIRLRYGFLVTCTGVDTDPKTGEITAIHATHDPETRGGSTPDGRKVSGTIHWVSASEGIEVLVNLYDRLFADPAPDSGDGSFLDKLNPDSLEQRTAIVEPHLKDATPGSNWQFERQGYFAVDTGSERLCFNRTVSLKDSWAKRPAPTPTAQPPVAKTRAPVEDGERRKRKRKGRSEVIAALHAADPELAARATRYTDALGLPEGDTLTLTSDRDLSDFFEAAIAVHDSPRSIANWVCNSVQAVAKNGSIDALPFDASALARLVALVDDGTLSSKGAKTVFNQLASGGGDPQEIVDRMDLAQLTDEDQIQVFVAQVVAAHAEQAAEVRGGNPRMFGFFVGQVMKASGGRAKPEVVNRLLKSALG